MSEGGSPQKDLRGGTIMKQQSLLKQYRFPLSFSLQLATLTVCVDQASGWRRNRTGSRQLARLRHSISRQVPIFQDLTLGTAIALEPPESWIREHAAIV
jgi:hypothetical protein